jgi:hypothetical protein
MTRSRLVAIVLALALAGGCIVSDNVTTLTVHPDGSADFVVFSSNIRSTETGAKSDEELRRYAEDFDARRNDEFDRINRAGGKVVDTWWVRRDAPYSNIVSARLPSSAAVEKLLTIDGEPGELRVATRYSQEGRKRKLSMSVQPPKDLNIAEITASSVRETRERQANGLSELRIVVLGGEITGSRGWTVAGDKRSALLALDEIADLLRASPGQIEPFIEWDVAP